MALESAAVMAGGLTRTDARDAPRALELHAKRAPDDSRRLAAMMTVGHLPLAWGRDPLLQLCTLEMLVKNIARSFAGAI